VDEETFRRLLDRVIAGGGHGLFVGGTVGLGSFLTNSEYRRMIAIAVDLVAGRLPLLAGVLEPSTARVLERIRMLEHAGGVSAVVVVAPYYIRAATDRQLLRHFEVIREHTALEMVAYNLPGCVGAELPATVLFEMARRGWITACKDSSGDAAYFTHLCRGGAEVGLRVYQGLRPDFAELARLGAAGCVPVPGNVRPECFVEAWRRRDHPHALPAWQQQCDTIWHELVVGTDYFSRSLQRLAAEGLGAGVMPEPFTV
jgi:4-hydroxy-tetrahydrodipicolinate synthase